MDAIMNTKLPNFGGTSTSGNDSKYFQTTKKGEIHELKEELNNAKMEKKKEAVKKVIAAMTVGKDVSMLFTDVVNCIQTQNIELKKLVYLYLINYAKSQPDLAILAVNTFVKDTQDPNPLVRALAVRTMGCIRVDKIVEYLCEPLRKCLKDEDPYVRKTSAVCVAKLFDINGELVEEQGFLEMVYDLLSDSNPMVVSNAVAALAEIAEQSEAGKRVFQINTATLQKMLAALNECTEWGQVFILDSLALYMPSDGREAESIIERVTPRLQHANSAVVLSAVKVMIKYMDLITSPDALKLLYKKMAPPLVTLLSSEAEIQYVALRNINLIVQKRPSILAHEIKVFFCKYNDPIYVKMEKLEIMIKLTSDKNVDQVLMELKEYATEVDVEFVRRSVRAIGRCAIKLERAAERCINVLLELIQTKVNYVVQEAVIVIKDIFRKFPNRYESIIGTLCENLDTLDEPEAKASMIWIIGEYAERIDNADELLESFLESFEEETPQVQLQMLTATVKLFLKRPAETQKMVQDVLTLATQDSDNPDLRDRGYIYWRLLSTDPEAAKQVVLAEKPNISDDTFSLDPTVLDELISHLSSLAAIYHKPPSTFVTGKRPVNALGSAQDDVDDDDDGSMMTSDMMMGDVGGTQAAPPAPPPPQIMDLLGGLMDDEPPAPRAAPAGMAAWAAAWAAWTTSSVAPRRRPRRPRCRTRWCCPPTKARACSCAAPSSSRARMCACALPLRIAPWARSPTLRSSSTRTRLGCSPRAPRLWASRCRPRLRPAARPRAWSRCSPTASSPTPRGSCRWPSRPTSRCTTSRTRPMCSSSSRPTAGWSRRPGSSSGRARRRSTRSRSAACRRRARWSSRCVPNSRPRWSSSLRAASCPRPTISTCRSRPSTASSCWLRFRSGPAPATPRSPSSRRSPSTCSSSPPPSKSSSSRKESSCVGAHAWRPIPVSL